MTAATTRYRARPEPDYPALGRQPEKLHIVPSRPNPWYGRIVPGADLTDEQQYELERLGKKAPTERLTVRRLASDKEMWWPTGSPRPYYAFVCPVLQRMPNGRYRVISPSGMVETIRDDGWTF